MVRRRKRRLAPGIPAETSRRGPVLSFFLLMMFLFGLLQLWDREHDTDEVKPPNPFTQRERIADGLEESLQSNVLPSEIDFRVGETYSRASVAYALDWNHQAFMEKLIGQYRPDYAAFVALDAQTGRILSIVSRTRSGNDIGHLALKATFPAASVFKIVTAAAALERKRLTPDSHIPFNGGLHTLYRRNVSQVDENKWTRYVTLSEAFAKSINTVFAKIGMYMLQPTELREFAEKFQFNQPIPSDVRVDLSHFELADGDPWAVAEVASGFNRVATLSPLQGALMAAAIVNDGIMMSPYVVDRLFTPEDGMVYSAVPIQLAVTLQPSTASALRELMHDTVRIGTSRTAFRPLFRRKGFSELEVGGKTGSLQGFHPKGKYDWFVGYAKKDDRRIAVAALTINEERWQVKSSHLAKTFIEEYFREKK